MNYYSETRKSREEEEGQKRRNFLVFGLLTVWILFAVNLIHHRKASQDPVPGVTAGETHNSHRLAEVDSAIGR